MAKTAHLWALGFDRMERAAEVRDEIAKLAERHCLALFDSAVAARYPDGRLVLDGEPFVSPIRVSGRGIAGFFASLALGAPPLTAAAVGSLERGIASGSPSLVGIEDDFVREVEQLMKPDSSALFVLGQAGNVDGLLEGIRGIGGTVLKTNVDPEWARQVQSALSSTATDR